jgi:para-aminobenzoate synthetase/4-amino-4-deoxychorismate lyase
MIMQTCESLDPALVFRLRLDLKSNGQLNITTGLLDPLGDSVKIFWAKDILSGNNEISSKNVLAGHKISYRPIYDAAWKAAQELAGFDALLLNEHGFVCEGGRSNIFIKLAGSQEWLTPPLSAGVLPGVMRRIILSDPHMNAREVNLTIKDVSMADEIILTNALRGIIQAHF